MTDQQNPSTQNPTWYDKLPKHIQKGHFFYDPTTQYLKLVPDECHHKQANIHTMPITIPQAHNIGTWSNKPRITKAVLQFENDTLVEIADISYKIHLTAEQLAYVMDCHGLVFKDDKDNHANN